MMPRVEAGDHTSEYEPKAFESLMQLSQLAVAGVHLCSPSLFDKKEAVREGGSARARVEEVFVLGCELCVGLSRLENTDVRT